MALTFKEKIMNYAILFVLATLLSACSSMSNRPDTAQAKACMVKSRAAADEKERHVDAYNKGTTMAIMMVWLGNEEDAYNACMGAKS